MTKEHVKDAQSWQRFLAGSESVAAPLTDEEWAATWEPGDAIDEALRLGVIDAARRHLAAGVPMVIWRDGRIVHVPAAEVLAELGAPISDVMEDPRS